MVPHSFQSLGHDAPLPFTVNLYENYETALTSLGHCIYIGSYINAHLLLNLLNELRKSYKFEPHKILQNI